MQPQQNNKAGFSFWSSPWHIALAIFGVVFVLCFILALWFTSRSGNVHNIVATGEAVRQETLSYSLRNAQGRVVVLDVLSDQHIDMGYGSSKTASDALRNQLFLDVDGNTSAMLFPTHEQLIVRVHEVTDRAVIAHYHYAKADEQAAVRARLYEVVTRDTNGDQRLSERDAKTLMLARADGTQLVELVTLAAPAESAPNPNSNANADNAAHQVKTLRGAELHAPHELRLLTLAPDGSTHLVRFDLERWLAQPPVALPKLP